VRRAKAQPLPNLDLMMNRNFSCAFSLVLGTLAIAACNSESADDTPVEASRAMRIESLADAACNRYEDTGAGCPGYGTGSGQKYADENACESDFKQKAEDLWPVDKCDDGRIDSSRFEVCLNKAKSFACSTGGQNILDAISALSECNADQVCTDSP